ncbi:MAG TPA: type II toxin-antitoxin system Phd/YefM family antitoxin [Lunatimonas sp.]|nr:type II toxin-antitoxin system Phd/YefM family antitoxin [Lunatimonas sp.]
MKAVTMAELRKSMKTYLDYVSKDSGTIIIPRKVGVSSVVMISEEEYNSMQETLYLLSTKANREALAESIRQVSEDNTVPFEAK